MTETHKPIEDARDHKDLIDIKNKLHNAQDRFDDFYHQLNEIMREKYTSLNSEANF